MNPRVRASHWRPAVLVSRRPGKRLYVIVGTYQRDCATLLGGGSSCHRARTAPTERAAPALPCHTHDRRRDGTKQGAAAGEYEDLFWPVPRAEASDPGDEQDDFSVDSLLEEEDVVCGHLQAACAWAKPCRKQVL